MMTQISVSAPTKDPLTSRDRRIIATIIDHPDPANIRFFRSEERITIWVYFVSGGCLAFDFNWFAARWKEVEASLAEETARERNERLNAELEKACSCLGLAHGHKMEIIIMPQVTATVASAKKSVEDLRFVEISFGRHKIYAGQKLIASIAHDEDLTQPWLVIVNGEIVHRAYTRKGSESYISSHYKQGTLPLQLPETPRERNKRLEAELEQACTQFGLSYGEIDYLSFSTKVYRDGRLVGFVGCNYEGWYSNPHKHGLNRTGQTAQEAIALLGVRAVVTA